MKKFILLIPILASCQWIVTHPEEDKEIVNVVEEIGKDLYKYEMGPQPLPATGTEQSK